MTDALDNTQVALWRKACAAALAGLPGMGPARLSALLTDMPPETAWQYIAEGRRLPAGTSGASAGEADKLAAAWRRVSRRTNPLDVLERYQDLDIAVWSQLGEYPAALMDDPWAPAVLFWQGTTAPLSLPRVAIVGTRHCTNSGREIARRFGAELAEAGVSVVSGLALGIDGEAHRGALDAWNGAPVVGVVGNGLDTVYPRANRALWSEVGTRGLLVSEAPLGAKPEPWRFPARNRIIAGLADLIVVVESHEHGGSLLTVDEAEARDVQVMAVPGSVHSPASRGTNDLLRDGCAPACCTDDILFALANGPAAGLRPAEPVPLPEPRAEDEQILRAVDWQPTPTDEVLDRTGLSLGETAAGLARLQELGWVVNDGGWWRRTDRRNEGEDGR